MEKLLEHTDPSSEAARWNKSSIYRVPERVKRQTRAEDFEPQLVSLGPFHHGKRRVLPMEEHKRRAVLHLARRARAPLRAFAAAVEAAADELVDAYDGLLDDDGWRGVGNGDSFVEVMLTDGCFLLEMMRVGRLVLKGKPVRDYAPNDPVFSIHGFYFLRPDIKSDMILMENQLPLLVLQRILAVERGTSSPVK
nr:unnamed protein product [Digitaria exilis]